MYVNVININFSIFKNQGCERVLTEEGRTREFAHLTNIFFSIFFFRQKKDREKINNEKIANIIGIMTFNIFILSDSQVFSIVCAPRNEHTTQRIEMDEQYKKNGQT